MGEGDYIPIDTLSPQNDSCIKMGSDDSHFNVSLIVRDKAHKQYAQTTTFEEKSRSGIEPRSFCLPSDLTARPNRLTLFESEVNMVLNVHRNHKAY